MSDFHGECIDYLNLKPEDVEVWQYTLTNYTWALDKCFDKTVVDCGAGTCFGSYLLTSTAKSVLALDRNEQALTQASNHLSFINTPWKCKAWDATKEKVPPAEVYVAFEFLEHLDDPKWFIVNLPKGSTLLFTTPLEGGLTEFHKQNFTIEGFKSLFPNGVSLEVMSRKDGQLYMRGIANL